VVEKDGDVEWSHVADVSEEVGRVERQMSERTASGISSDEEPVYSLGTSHLSFPLGFGTNIYNTPPQMQVVGCI
jgi:hypothetical protein